MVPSALQHVHIEVPRTNIWNSQEDDSPRTIYRRDSDNDGFVVHRANIIVAVHDVARLIPGIAQWVGTPLDEVLRIPRRGIYLGVLEIFVDQRGPLLAARDAPGQFKIMISSIQKHPCADLPQVIQRGRHVRAVLHLWEQ